MSSGRGCRVGVTGPVRGSHCPPSQRNREMKSLAKKRIVKKLQNQDLNPSQHCLLTFGAEKVQTGSFPVTGRGVVMAG